MDDLRDKMARSARLLIAATCVAGLIGCTKADEPTGADPQAAQSAAQTNTGGETGMKATAPTALDPSK